MPYRTPMPSQAIRPDDGMLPKVWPLAVTVVLWGIAYVLGMLVGGKA